MTTHPPSRTYRRFRDFDHTNVRSPTGHPMYQWCLRIRPEIPAEGIRSIAKLRKIRPLDALGSRVSLGPGRSVQKILSRKPAFFDPEPRGDEGSDIGEALANADVEWLAVDYEERDPLAGVVRTFEGWVVSVVCSDDHEIFCG